MHKAKRWFIVCSLVLLLQGCTEPPQLPLTFAGNDWSGYYPIFLADKLGYIDPQQINVTQQVSSSEVLRHLHAGTIEVGAVTLDEALLLLQDEVDIRIFLVADFSAGGDGIIAQPSLQTIQDLKGKRIGVENTALGAFVLDRALSMAGISDRDVKTVPLEISEHFDAFVNNRIDAVVTFEPVLSQITAHGGNKVFDSTQIPGEIVDVIVVTEQAMAAQPERIAHFVDAWFRALAYMKDRPRDAYERLLPEGLSFAEYQQALTGIHLPDRVENQALFSNQAEQLEAVRRTLNPVMLNAQLLSKDVRSIPLFDGRFVAGAVD